MILSLCIRLYVYYLILDACILLFNFIQHEF